MHAMDIAEPCMTVTADQDVLPALRQLLDGPTDCLVVVDEAGEPYHLVQGHELVRMLLPGFVVAHPGLAALHGLAPPRNCWRPWTAAGSVNACPRCGAAHRPCTRRRASPRPCSAW